MAFPSYRNGSSLYWKCCIGTWALSHHTAFSTSWSDVWTSQLLAKPIITKTTQASLEDTLKPFWPWPLPNSISAPVFLTISWPSGASCLPVMDLGGPTIMKQPLPKFWMNYLTWAAYLHQKLSIALNASRPESRKGCQYLRIKAILARWAEFARTNPPCKPA